MISDTAGEFDFLSHSPSSSSSKNTFGFTLFIFRALVVSGAASPSFRGGDFCFRGGGDFCFRGGDFCFRGGGEFCFRGGGDFCFLGDETFSIFVASLAFSTSMSLNGVSACENSRLVV